MKILLLFLSILFCTPSLAQKEVRMAGDTTNEKFMNSVRTLEKQGWKVEIVSESEITNSQAKRSSVRENYVGKQVPSFILSDINGNNISSEDLKGKAVHINFWSVTCAPCIEEFPELNKLREKYQEDGVVFLAIAPESKTKVNKVLEKNPLNYTVIADAANYFKEVGISGYPVNFFVNSNGIITEVAEGSRYKGEMIDGKMEMIPDNFNTYNKIIKNLD
ncbi:peroxiredoxin family protein [Fulvivirga sedimenti]|uniref:TlpA family protein disulfide reductase n=1 Tax=Fulvivirga sedimenti TaxID=2879465 RepID=A0A9X1HKU9_9BACT|nr:TlpA disulfide reductase family protein [Fulvivirga sedimenti]MCA6073746.1 TlpA family protein disulfide reductase [Fulvivirga sedimenti]